MAWNAPTTRATGDLITASEWNALLGASGALAFVSTHGHSGAAGDGATDISAADAATAVKKGLVPLPPNDQFKVLKGNAAFAYLLEPVVADSTAGGTANDFDVSAIATLRYSGNGQRSYTGFAPGIANPAGRLLAIVVAGTADDEVILKHQNTGSAVENRIITPDGLDFVIPDQGGAVLTYDATSDKWRVIGYAIAPASVSDITDIAATEAAGTNNGTFALGSHGHAHGSGYLPDAHHAQVHGSSDHDGTVEASIDIQVFTSSDTWTKPANAKAVEVIVIGAGGGGGGAAGRPTGQLGSGGGGAGAGALLRRIFDADALGANETVTIGAAGTGGAGGSTSEGNAGGAGGNSSFGSHLTAYGGGGGGRGNLNPGSVGFGGGGGGASSAGGTGTGASGAGGGPAVYSKSGGTLDAAGSQGATGANAADGGNAESGGGGGASSANINGTPSAAGFDGGSALVGAGAGGAGGGVGDGNAAAAGGDGGATGSFSASGGGAGGAAGANAGTAGTSRSGTGKAGDGGGGGGATGTTSTTGGRGGDGGVPGGGAGGGGVGNATGGAGGDGGRGEVICISYF